MSLNNCSLIYNNLSDCELADYIKQGDNKAFEELSNRYTGVILSVSKNYHIDGFDYYDFLQEGLLALLSAARSFNSTMNVPFKAYLTICAKRRFISVLRKSQGKSVIPDSERISIDDALLTADNSKNPEELLLNKEYINNLKTGIAVRLSDKEKKVLSLYLAGYSYIEIANSLGITVKAVDNALQRIKKKLSTLSHTE